MSELHIPLDPLNPGQFFACCGLLELATMADDGVLARFEADEAMPRRATFVLQSGSAIDLPRLLSAVRTADVAFEDAGEDSTRPVRLGIGGRVLVLDWWLNEFRDSKTNLKCWAGRVKTKQVFPALLKLVQADVDPQRLLATVAIEKSKFGVDARSAWNARDVGFSPDKHGPDVIYPWVEVLAAVGLQGFRPNAERRQRVEYFLWTVPLLLEVARLAAVASWDGLPRFRYQFSIRDRGQSYKFFTFAEFKERKEYYE